jgi:hypothetical protein
LFSCCSKKKNKIIENQTIILMSNLSNQNKENDIETAELKEELGKKNRLIEVIKKKSEDDINTIIENLKFKNINELKHLNEESLQSANEYMNSIDQFEKDMERKIIKHEKIKKSLIEIRFEREKLTRVIEDQKIEHNKLKFKLDSEKNLRSTEKIMLELLIIQKDKQLKISESLSENQL